MKNQVRQRKPIPFSWRLENKWSKNECFLKWDMECLREREMGKIVNSHKNLREKLKNNFKNCPYCAKHAFFATEVSRQKVTSFTCQNTSSQKFWKSLVSVFHNWKSHSRGSRELSHENLCVPLATGPSTREQVIKTDPRARDCGMRLGWPATESPKQGNTVFEIFNFCKNKILSKNT